MEFRNKFEQGLYERSGGGDKGEYAVKQWREYQKQNDEYISSYARLQYRARFAPRNEKSQKTSFAEREYE